MSANTWPQFGDNYLTIIAGECVTLLAILMAAWSWIAGNYGMSVFACLIVVYTTVLGVLSMARMKGVYELRQSWKPQLRRPFDCWILLFSIAVFGLNVGFVAGLANHNEILWRLGTFCLVMDAAVNLCIFVSEIIQGANVVSNFSSDFKNLWFFNLGAGTIALLSTIHLPSRIFLEFSDEWCQEVHLGKNPRALIVNILMHLALAGAQVYGIWKHPFPVEEGFCILAAIMNTAWSFFHVAVYLLMHEMARRYEQATLEQALSRATGRASVDDVDVHVEVDA